MECEMNFIKLISDIKHIDPTLVESVHTAYNVIMESFAEFTESGNVKATAYHGTDDSFNEFDFSQAGKYQGLSSNVMFFSDNIEVAKNYGANIHKVELNLNNPLIISDWNEFISKHDEAKATEPDWDDIDLDDIETSLIYMADVSISNIIKVAKGFEYDGVVIHDMIDGGPASTVYVAFDKSQVKLINNSLNENADIDIELVDEVTDSFSGQTNHVLWANVNGIKNGYIEYVVFGDEVTVEFIRVTDSMQRKGIASKLMLKLQEMYPTTHIIWGYTTDDGTKLHDNMKDKMLPYEKSAKGSRELKAKTLLEKLYVARDRIIALFDNIKDHDTRNDMSKRLYSIYDKIHKIESEFRLVENDAVN